MSEQNDAKKMIFYTTGEIASLLKMNVQVITRKLKHGELIGYKIGKDWRVKESDLMAWMEKHSNKNVMSPGEKVVGRFLKNGKFETLPSQRKKLKYILQHILNAFKLNQVYSEKEVNEIITRYHDDYCRIRREFVDERMMYRKDGIYRRNSGYKYTK